MGGGGREKGKEVKSGLAMELLGIYFHLEETKFKVDGERTERWSNVLSRVYPTKKGIIRMSRVLEKRH